MKKIFLTTFCIAIVLSMLTTSFLFYKNKGFETYIVTKYEQNSNSGVILDTKLTKILNIGHDLSYANMKWISLIQYLGSTTINRNEGQIDYLQKLLAHISEISPFFDKVYEWSLFLLPIPTTIDPEYSDEQKIKLQPSLNLAYKGMEKLCDNKKIEEILSQNLDAKLWENKELQNPCKNGMIAYLIAFYGGQLGGNSEIAKKYYTISSMQSDTPTVSKILATINSSGKKNHKNLALNFSLIALGGYDKEPFKCLALANENITILQEKIKKEYITFLQDHEKDLEAPSPESSLGKQTCYDMLERGIKYTYLEFINQEGKKYADINKIEELLQKIGLDNPPTVKTQENMTFCKRGDLWDYCSK